MPSPRTVLLTGAAGGVGTLLRGLLPEYGYRLRLLDLKPVENESAALTLDLAAAPEQELDEALRGADAVVHLAGISLESTFEQILHANILGTQRLYEAARRVGVDRIVLASSNHAVGFAPRPTGSAPLIPVDTPRRPDTYYGLSKSFCEDLAQLYHDLHGIETVSLRIGSCFRRPTSVRMLSLWLSPADGARLVHAALTAEGVGHTVAYGSSANTRLWWDLGSARALGYEPQDDSETYAPELLAQEGELDPDDPASANLGGHFCTDPPIWPH